MMLKKLPINTREKSFVKCQMIKFTSMKVSLRQKMGQRFRSRVTICFSEVVVYETQNGLSVLWPTLAMTLESCVILSHPSRRHPILRSWLQSRLSWSLPLCAACVLLQPLGPLFGIRWKLIALTFTWLGLSRKKKLGLGTGISRHSVLLSSPGCFYSQTWCPFLCLLPLKLSSSGKPNSFNGILASITLSKTCQRKFNHQILTKNWVKSRISSRIRQELLHQILCNSGVSRLGIHLTDHLLRLASNLIENQPVNQQIQAKSPMLNSMIWALKMILQHQTRVITRQLSECL